MENKDFIDSKFRYVILVAMRAKQLVKGAKPKIDIKAGNPLTIAIEEFNQGKIHFRFIEKKEQEVLFAEEEEGEIPQEEEQEETDEPEPTE